MREFEIKPGLMRILQRLSKRDKALYDALLNKIDEILGCADPEHYKNLSFEMRNSKRVHVGHFVLVFSYEPTKDFVSFEDFDHHDNICKI